MAIYAIGDLQGCFDELQQLLKIIDFQADVDQLWLVGDLVNRGPKSLETLRFIKGLGDSAIAVLGNHDLHLLAVAHGVKKNRGETLDAVLAAKDRDELLHWLRHRPLLHHDAKVNYTLVHAGITPHWTLAQAQSYAKELENVLRGDDYIDFLNHMYGNEPACWSDGLTGWDRLRYICNSFTRLRYCNKDGVLNLQDNGPPGSQPETDMPWFDVPNRKNTDINIIFGHWATLGVHSAKGLCGLDSACVWGGKLTAVRLDSSPAKYYSVACQAACRQNNI